MFKYDNNTLSFQTGFVAAIYLLNCLFFYLNRKGQSNTLQEFFSSLKEKSNLICRYKIVKTALLKKKSLRFNMTCCPYMYIQKNSKT